MATPFIETELPEVVPMPATDELLLVQVPPAVALDNVVADPTHADVVPVIAAGDALTVTVAVRTHPVEVNV